MASHSDWLSLVELTGLVVSEPVLETHFPGGPPRMEGGRYKWFRRQAERFEVSQSKQDYKARQRGATEWIDFLTQWLLELPVQRWQKANDVPADLTLPLDEFDQTLRPSRVLHRDGTPQLLLNVVPPDQSLDRREMATGRWKASPTSKMDRLLRGTGQSLGLVTNGHSFRLVHAPQGISTGHITWTSRLLVEEKAALDAFCTLLGKDVLLPEKAEAVTLDDLCRSSIDRQGDVADQLGEQVRNGLERLIWAWDAADRGTGGVLLAEMTEDDIYEMGLVVMMRLVFMLYAEERHLLPHGQILYDQGYGLTYLWHRLQDQKRENPGKLDQTYDAWDRFLGTCRLIFDGSRHPDLSLIAYGGSLFDPARFPALEDKGCRISNRVMHDILRMLLFARQSRGGEPQRVGYWALDVEQIGYVYEGLLDHRCARAPEHPMVKLKGAGEEAIPLTELEDAAGGWRPSGDRDNPPPEVLAQTIAGHLHKRPKPDDLQRVSARLSAAPEGRDVEALKCFPEAVAERVLPFASMVQCDEIVPPHWRYLTTGTSRRASGAHYTPQSLTERVVRVTLEPQVFRCEDGKPGRYLEPRQVKSAQELLSLKVCDIAMGSGAFLVQVVRYLGDRLVEAWDVALAKAQEENPDAVLSMPFAEPSPGTVPTRDRDINPEDRDEMVLWARRFVAERCIYGVDVNPLAVEMSKLSLWLTTLAQDRAFTFLDHALRCGDSLVGVDQKQLSTWSLSRDGDGAPLLEHMISQRVRKAAGLRADLREMPVVDVDDVAHKQSLLDEADTCTDRLRLAADLLVAPSFSGLDSRKQETLRKSFLNRFTAKEENVTWEALQHERNRLLRQQRTFHWPLEFPEVFEGDRPGFDAIVGNPPFVGGQFIRRQLGDDYVPYLRSIWPRSHGTADLVAFFFLKSFESTALGGVFGLIGTNTISQGDTRESGLDEVYARGGRIFAAQDRMPWPGHASVNVSLVHVFKGTWSGGHRLGDETVHAVSTALTAGEQHEKPRPLRANENFSFQGSNILGLGFTMPPEEAQAYIDANPRNSEVLFPYLNGRDLNTHPGQQASRWVINFRDWPLEKAKEWPELLEVVEDKVRPQREAIKGRDSTSEDRRRNWWRFTRPTLDLYNAIEPLDRVLVRAQVSNTHAPVLVSPEQVFSHKVVVFPTGSAWTFCVLQAGIHETWAVANSSTMRTDVSYTPSDCFETFPFPPTDQPMQDRLDFIGEEYHEHRRRLMLDNDKGLTATYNRFHDPEDESSGIVRLRELHVQMDLAVRDAYGWSDLDLEHGWVKTVSIVEKKNRRTGKVAEVEKVEWRYTISDRAKEEVLLRLRRLNHERYEQEVRQGLHDKKKNKKRTARKAGGNAKADDGKTNERKPFRLSNPVDKKKGDLL